MIRRFWGLLRTWWATRRDVYVDLEKIAPETWLKEEDTES